MFNKDTLVQKCKFSPTDLVSENVSTQNNYLELIQSVKVFNEKERFQSLWKSEPMHLAKLTNVCQYNCVITSLH